MNRNPPDWEGMRAGIIGFGSDSYRKSYYPELQKRITELETTREQLRESEENLRGVFNSVYDAIIIHDAEGHVVEANDAMLSLYGVDRTNFQTFTLADYSERRQKPPPIQDICARVERQGCLVVEWNARRPTDDVVFEVEVALRPMVWYGERLFVAVVRDVTERKRLERLLGESQKMEALGRFAAKVAHDVTNSMTSILGAVSLIRKRLPADSDCQAELGVIIDSVERYAGFYGDLLAFAAQRPTRERVVNLTRIANSLSGLLAQSAHPGVECVFHITDTSLSVYGDPTQIEQLLVYLTLHAIERMPEGGTYTLTVTRRLDTCSPDGTNMLGALAMQEYACLMIGDTGAAYDPADVDHLFEPFFEPASGSRNQLGVRLSAVYTIVHALNGHIFIQSEPQSGTVVTVLVPLAVEPRTSAGDKAETAESADESVAQGTALVVDDEPGIRALLTMLLSKQGLHVMVAEHAEVAFSRSCHYPGHIQYLFVDMDLGGLSGKQVAARIQASRPTIQVVYISGYDRSGLEARGLIKKTDWFLHKPFDRNDVMTLLAKIRVSTPEVPDESVLRCDR